MNILDPISGGKVRFVKGIKKPSTNKRFSLKKFPVFDYSQALEIFVEKLEQLEAHIRAHRIHTEWKRDADEIKKAIALYRKYSEEFHPMIEQKLLKEFFEYIGEHMMGWWC